MPAIPGRSIAKSPQRLDGRTRLRWPAEQYALRAGGARRVAARDRDHESLSRPPDEAAARRSNRHRRCRLHAVAPRLAALSGFRRLLITTPAT
jgi:hypothetical protein